MSMTILEAERGQRGECLGWSGGCRRELRDEVVEDMDTLPKKWKSLKAQEFFR